MVWDNMAQQAAGQQRLLFQGVHSFRRRCSWIRLFCSPTCTLNISSNRQPLFTSIFLVDAFAYQQCEDDVKMG